MKPSFFEAYHGDLKDSACIKHLYASTYDDVDGETWSNSELELLAVLKGGRPFGNTVCV